MLILRRLKSLTPALLDALLGFHPLPQCMRTPAAMMSHSHTEYELRRVAYIYFAHNTDYCV